MKDPLWFTLYDILQPPPSWLIVQRLVVVEHRPIIDIIGVLLNSLI
jgi:hypothetical protein